MKRKQQRDWVGGVVLRVLHENECYQYFKKFLHIHIISTTTIIHLCIKLLSSAYPGSGLFWQQAKQGFLKHPSLEQHFPACPVGSGSIHTPDGIHRVSPLVNSVSVGGSLPTWMFLEVRHLGDTVVEYPNYISWLLLR